MSQGIPNLDTTPRELHAIYAVIREDLDQAEAILRDELQSEFPFVDRLVKHGFRLGGKRMRPALVLMSGKACGRISRDHASLAAVVEMIHTATLIHDDVLDEAAIRRHLDTVNARWNNEASVLLGDYLFTRSICLVGELGDAAVTQAIVESCRTMCEGELRQVAARGDYELTEDQYLEIIGSKTAAFCACCCWIGAHAAGASAEVCDLLSQFGHKLGIAFQIIDDVLDFRGDEAVTGKSLGTDLVKQKSTLPLIHLLSQVADDDRQAVLDILADSPEEHRGSLKPWFERFGCIEYARDTAIGFVREAGELLDQIEVTPAAESLKQLADFIVTRRQ